MAINEWSTTASSNASGVTNVNWAEGQAPSTVNDSARNLMADVATWYGQASGKMPEYLTGVAGTNTVTATGPAAMAAYAAGQRFTFIPANTNTGATTINITPSGASALGAKNIFISGQACAGGELVANIPTTLLYDGTQFNILGKIKTPTVQVYTSTGANTWTKPTGLAYVIVDVVGGGANGGSAASSGGSSSAGGGGGAGGYSRKRILAASLGATETATVGAAATNSTFGAHCTGNGGSAGGNGAADTVGAGGAGGSASGGDINISGGDGNVGAIGGTAASSGGLGGSSFFGGAGAGTDNAVGGNSSGKGSGGGGAGDRAGGASRSGGNGSAGIIIVQEFYC